MLRIAYVCILRLHPSYFRIRFADEMLSIFDEETGRLAAVKLITDGTLSLLRQWTIRQEFWQEPSPALNECASEGVPSFHAVDDGRPFSGTLFNGIMPSVAVFGVFALAIVYGQNQIPERAGSLVIQDYGLAVLSNNFNAPVEIDAHPVLPAARVATPTTFWSQISTPSAWLSLSKRTTEPLLGVNSPLHPQRVPATQSPTVPEWQRAAGGKMAFDAASIKPSSGPLRTNVSLSALDGYPPKGGLFSATFTLNAYIEFAYKLTGDQDRLLQPQLPKWATMDLFDIEARADGNPTKDQMRLMMQALLADRFSLAVHFETRQLPVFALELSKPGKTGLRLIPHTDDPPCPAFPTPGSAPPAPAKDDGWPPPLCGSTATRYVSGRERWATRNMTMGQIASLLVDTSMGMLDRPVLDQTGLIGKFDARIEFTPEISGPYRGPPDFQPDTSGPSFIEALQEQLGLKLKSQTGPVDVLVIDHVEQPSPN